MKKLLALLMLSLCFAAAPAQAQFNGTLTQSNTLIATGVSGPMATGNVTTTSLNVGLYQLTWWGQGTVSTCTIGVEVASTSGGSYSGAGNTQTCTSNGSYSFFLAPASTNAYVHVNLSVLSGAGATINYTLNAFQGTPVAGTGVLGTTITDGMVFIPATQAGCFVTPTTLTQTLTTVRAALNNTVMNSTTNAAAGSEEWDCDITSALASRTTALKGVTITAINEFYGTQAATATSLANATYDTVTYPAVGGAASGTVSSILPATVTPGMSHSTPTATTSGQCVNEGNVLTTPLQLTAAIARITYSQVFSQTAASAMTIQLCGFQVLFTYTN